MFVKVRTKYYRGFRVLSELEEGVSLDMSFINKFLSPVEVIYFIPIDFLREQIDKCKNPDVEFTDSVYFSPDTIDKLEVLIASAKRDNAAGIYVKASNL